MLLAFLKLSFLGVAGLLLLASVPLRREEMPRAWGFLLGLACTVTVFAIYLRFAISAFLFDMRLTVQARAAQLHPAGYLGGIVGNAEILTLAIVTVVAMLLIARGGLWQRYAVRLLLIGGVVIATSAFFRQTNRSDDGFQLARLWPIILLGLLIAAYPHCKEKVAVSSVIVVSLGSVFAGFFLDGQSLRTLLRYHAPSVMSQGVSVNGPGMERLKFYENDQDPTSITHFDNGHFLVDHVNDGLALLEKSSNQNESILTLGFINPFPYILRRKPAFGGSPWEKVDDNFPSTHLLDESLVFGNADLIMVPNYPNSNEDSDMILVKAYHPYLLQHFSFVANSQW